MGETVLTRVDWDESAHPHDATPAFTEAFEQANAIFVPERRTQELTLSSASATFTPGQYLRGDESGATARVVDQTGATLRVALRSGRLRSGEGVRESTSPDGLSPTSVAATVAGLAEPQIGFYPVRNVVLRTFRQIVCESQFTEIRGVHPYSSLLVPDELPSSFWSVRLRGGMWRRCGRLVEVSDRTAGHPVFDSLWVQGVRPRLVQELSHAAPAAGLERGADLDRGGDSFEVAEAYKVQTVHHGPIQSEPDNVVDKDHKGVFRPPLLIDFEGRAYEVLAVDHGSVTLRVPQTVTLPASGTLRERTRSGNWTGDTAAVTSVDPPSEHRLLLYAAAATAPVAAGEQLARTGGPPVDVQAAEPASLDSGAAFRFSDALKGTWRNCHLSYGGQEIGAPEIGIEMVAGQNVAGQNNACTVECCYFFFADQGRHAISIDESVRGGGRGVNGLTVRDCIIERTGEAGISVRGSCRGLVIENNYFEHNGGGGNPDIDLDAYHTPDETDPNARQTQVIVAHNYFAPGPPSQPFRLRTRRHAGVTAVRNAAHVGGGVFCSVDSIDLPVVLEQNRLQGDDGDKRSYRETLYSYDSTSMLPPPVSWSSTSSDNIDTRDPHHHPPHLVHAGDVVSRSNARAWGLLEGEGQSWRLVAGYNVLAVGFDRAGRVLVKTIDPLPESPVILGDLRGEEALTVQAEVTSPQSFMLGLWRGGELGELPAGEARLQFVVFG